MKMNLRSVQKGYMKGLELAERFYLEYGVPMIRDSFPELEGLIAVGLAGSGSECLGFDDEASQDHDFEPGFCLFLPEEELVDSRSAFALERAYAKLPKEFLGYKRSCLSPVGGNRHGVIRISDFLESKIGSPSGVLALRDWFFVPEQSLAEVTDGKLFRDDFGHFTAIRNELAYMPEDVRLKKLAGELLVMGQSGQYNFPRCLSRGDTAAAQLSVFEFVKSSMHVIFLLNKVYMPYYKWSFRALRELPILSELYEPMEYLISSGNTHTDAEKKKLIEERICADVISVLTSEKLTKFRGSQMEGHAYSVNDGISDPQIRNLHILYAV